VDSGVEEVSMLVFDLQGEQAWNPEHHVERVLGKVADGDVTVACWEPGQVSPYHCHPGCTEIYFCYQGGGQMHTPERTVDIVPGSFVVHPPGELHEYVNGPQRTLLFRVRYGTWMESRKTADRGKTGWQQSPEDIEFFARHPGLLTAEVK
jgi:mannose-6-phosphate isomerase-like protein (cupin superfamily)